MRLAFADTVPHRNRPCSSLLLLLGLYGGDYFVVAASPMETSTDLVEDVCSTTSNIINTEADAGSGGVGTSCSGSESVTSSTPSLLPEFDFVYEEYEAGQYVDAFFDSLQHDEDSCVDASDECEDEAERGLCMTDPDKMKELGCDRSCLYCITESSRELFSLGVDQITGQDDDEEICEDENVEECEEDARKGFCTIDPDRMEERGCFRSCLYCRTPATDKDLFLRGVDQTIKEVGDRPSPREVAEVMAKSERYFVDEVLVNESLGRYRLECRNDHALCAYWAAQGECEVSPGEMGENCAAACRNCLLVDFDVRCPIDTSTNIFKPGDMHAMFERLLQEAGYDVTSFSKENLPTGGSVPGIGELTVITSPYHDPPRDNDEEDEEEISPLPWVMSIDGFLSGEECNRLIEIGESQGYRKSRVASDVRGVYKESKGRTSYNTFCGESCAKDPIVNRVIERMTNLTGIPYDNYEGLQLVRYEPGQFYKKHHDESGVKKYSGPRILTFFLYLNDVLGGGGTEFQYLNFTATPKKGSALIWPSMLDSLEGRDEWTFHEALPVEKGFKYGANAWIRLRDYQNAKC